MDTACTENERDREREREGGGRENAIKKPNYFLNK